MKVDNTVMTRRIDNISKQAQGGNDCSSGHGHNSKPPEPVSVPLANNRGFVLIDAEDYELVSKHRWHILIAKHTSYANAKTKIDNKWTTVQMHRLIMSAPKDKQVDHRDGNGLNNRKENLRLCTNHQNSMNKKKHRKWSSKYRGVHWHKKSKKWYAGIRVKGNRIHLGVFKDEIDAAEAYNEGAIKHFGEFANLNEIN